MDSLFLANLSSPPLLFFFLGAAAALVRSDLEIPTQIAKFLSIYLLFAIGFKGGVALSQSAPDSTVFASLLAAIALASLVPVYAFFLLKRRMSTADAAAVAATYGSVSAVTFVTCTSYLDSAGIPWSGYLVATMALMESPAIIVGILLYRYYGARDSNERIDWTELGRESCLNGSVFLIIGSMLIGWITGPAGMAQVDGLVSGLFTGMLCLFLLDMGIVAARRLNEAWRERRNQSVPVDRPGAVSLASLFGFAIALPIVNAIAAGLLAFLLDMSEGDALLLTILGASASYIAVPAAMRLALPEANPSTYLPMSLAITFPLNLLIGIPLYHQAIRWVLGN